MDLRSPRSSEKSNCRRHRCSDADVLMISSDFNVSYGRSTGGCSKISRISCAIPDARKRQYKQFWSVRSNKYCIKLCLNLSKPNQWVVRRNWGKFDRDTGNWQTGNISDKNGNVGSRFRIPTAADSISKFQLLIFRYQNLMIL